MRLMSGGDSGRRVYHHDIFICTPRDRLDDYGCDGAQEAKSVEESLKFVDAHRPPRGLNRIVMLVQVNFNRKSKYLLSHLTRATCVTVMSPPKSDNVQSTSEKTEAGHSKLHRVPRTQDPLCLPSRQANMPLLCNS